MTANTRAAPLAAPLAALLALGCATAEIDSKNSGVRTIGYQLNGARLTQNGSEAVGCQFGGRWYAAGAAVAAEQCVRCVCARGGALQCARRACVDSGGPAGRCYLRRRRGACCPELHCPGGVRLLEQAAAARADHDAEALEANVFPVCVEEGVVYAAGSALTSRVACEQCFCLGGERRCVSPRCPPPPPGCRALHAGGACCPQRYHCQHAAVRHCLVRGERVSEGERARLAESGACERCYCLRGALHCQPLDCAAPLPPLLGCTPLLRPGDCCPHQYRCHNHSLKPTPPVAMKVKRHTAAPTQPPLSSPAADTPLTTTDQSNEHAVSTTELDELTTSDQPDETVMTIINGTINCTAELSVQSQSSELTAPHWLEVNVTGSLRANISHPPLAYNVTNTNTTATQQYDEDYVAPTLPPSLPNLKIIPFVAADAVVEAATPPPPPLERADHQPVYWADDHGPPPTAPPAAAPEALFSPPIQTEGGFVPKGPGILGEYYAVYPGSTSAAPLLSTSMPLPVPQPRDECGDGEQLAAPCERCTCLWGRLHCTRDSTLCHDEVAVPHDEDTPTTQPPSALAADHRSGTTALLAPLDTTTTPLQHTTLTAATPAESSLPVTASNEHTTASDTTAGDDDDDDDGFSFGSVLKLLLSEAYDAPSSTTSTRRPPTAAPFVPLPHRTITPISLNRIDHLVLGESTAIRQPTVNNQDTVLNQPTVNKQTTVLKQPTKFQKPTVLKQPTVLEKPSVLKQASSVKRPSSGLPALSGCNVYGRTYGVGRDIPELSAACRQCVCSLAGVQCHDTTCDRTSTPT